MLRLCSCSLAAALALSASAAMAASPHVPDGSTAIHSPAKAAVNVARLEEEGDVVVAPESECDFQSREQKRAAHPLGPCPRGLTHASLRTRLRARPDADC